MRHSMFYANIYFLGLVTTSVCHNSVSGSPAVGGSTMKCTRYSGIQGPNPTCNDDAHMVCFGGCTGAVVASQCKRENNSSAPASQLMCTISYSQPSVDRGVCVNHNGTFNCQGIPQGEATCSGCAPVESEPVFNNARISNSSNPQPILSGVKNSTSFSTAAMKIGRKGLILCVAKGLGLIGILTLIL